MEFQIRQANPADAEAVVRMHTIAHHESYSHLLPPEFFVERLRTLTERIEKRRPFLAGGEPRLIALDTDGERQIGLDQEDIES